MSAAENKAVFLSYAREDTDAARRIAEALRSHGVEVWFDENELRGGDSWDQKIRQQIKDCALFLPVISAHTQDRGEGYFRLEWKLAVERTHLMAEGVPFLAPVVVDETSDSGAIVPAEFMRVQWTRLPGALPTTQFVAQVIRLLEAPRKPSAATRPAFPMAAPAAVTTPATTTPRSSGIPLWLATVVGVALVGAVTFLALRPAAKGPPVAETKSVVPAPNTSSLLPTAAAAAADKSIAVLPFENMSEDKSNAYFCDGVQEDILTHLANVRELRVVSRTSVEQYRNTTKPIRQIAQELGVAWILEGSVQRAGNKVRVTGQLINARTDQHVWAKAFDRDLTDIFAIQSELAQTIAASLQAALSPQEKDLINQRPTDNLAAYDLVLKARELRRQPTTTAGWQKSQINLLEAAVRLDPNYAVAYADLTFAYAFAYFISDHPTTADLTKAKTAIDTAVRLAPDSPDVIRALGDFYYYGHSDFARAMEQYDKVSLVRPNDPELLNRVASIQRRQGHWLESLATFRKLEELDPGSMHNARDIAILLCAGRRFGEASVEARRIAERVPDDLTAGFDSGYLSYIASGSTQEIDGFFARLSTAQADSPTGRELRRMWALRHGDLDEVIKLGLGTPIAGEAGGDRVLGLAIAFVVKGGTTAARVGLEPYAAELRAEVETGQANWSAWSYLGAAEALLSHKDEALRCGRKAVEMTSRDALASASTRAVLAMIQAWNGDKDAAIAEFARLLRTPFGSVRGGGGSFPDGTIAVMKRDPFYTPLRGDPRFEALLNDPKNNAPLF